jgi:excisionase family DNA binding protein
MPEHSSPVPQPRRQPARAGTSDASTPCLADLAKLPPTVSVEAAARLLGCGRSLAYELVQRGEFPCPVLRLGRRYVVPTAGLLRALGIEAEAEDSRTAPR